MTTEPEKSQKEPLAPSRAVRLALWFGIYLFGFGIYVLMMADYDLKMQGDPDVSQDIGIQRLLVILLTFPFGLASFFRYPWNSGMILSYAAYLVHLTLIYRVKSGRLFALLILILAGLVTCNVSGCSALTTLPIAK